MLILQMALVLGLVLHKIVWEVMKTRGGASGARRHSPSGLRKQLVKYLKGMVLAALISQTLFLDLFPIADEPVPLRITGMVIYSLGLAYAVIGRLQLGNNWANLEDFQVLSEQSLVNNGIYAYVRHPIYAGDILLLIGLELALNSWLVLATFIPLLVVLKQAAAEEALLSEAFEEYKEYREQTKRFIPFVV